jgi:hypothetical protein
MAENTSEAKCRIYWDPSLAARKRFAEVFFPFGSHRGHTAHGNKAVAVGSDRGRADANVGSDLDRCETAQGFPFTILQHQQHHSYAFTRNKSVDALSC